MIQILIVYSGATSTGSTATLAEWIKQGASSVSGTNVTIKEASTVTLDDVTNANGIICGSGDYNGNPEPSMINFLDDILKAGSSSKLTNLRTLPFGVFATSAGYSTGVQEVLNSMARSLMTFGAIFVGGGDWHTGQGIAGMTQKTSDEHGWDWADKDGIQKYLKEDSCEYGRRIALAASTLPEGMNKADRANPNKCSPPSPSPPSPSPPSPSPPSEPLQTDQIVNIVLLVTGLVLLASIVLFGYTERITTQTSIIMGIIAIACIIALVISSDEDSLTQRKTISITGIIATFCTLLICFVATYYNYLYIGYNGSFMGISFLFILTFFGLVLLLSSGNGSELPPNPPNPPTPPTPSPCKDTHCVNGKCDPSNGKCVCDPGWTGPDCNTKRIYSGISTPNDIPNPDIEKYCKQNYPLLSTYHKDFWKSLDFFWNTTCAASQAVLPNKSKLYIPSQDTTSANVIFRDIVKAFRTAQKSQNQKSLSKWMSYSPAPEEASSASKSGFSYNVNENGPAYHFSQSTPVYGLTLFPLCSFMHPGDGILLQGIVVNRYPPGHERLNAESYALSGTANKVIDAEVIPGIDLIHLNEGFKDHSLVEIAHCDTHMKTIPSTTDNINSCDLLATKCAGHGPPGMGNGKWVYYARGSGIWTNIGNTVVFKNKVHAVLECINMWDGKDKRDGKDGTYVDNNYQGTLKGKFDYTKLQDWQRFVQDKDGTVKKALTSILTAACLCPAKQTCQNITNTNPKYASKPSTAVIYGLGDNQPNNCWGDPLNLSDTKLYTGPCTSSPSYCQQTIDGVPVNRNNVPIWWFHDPDISNPASYWDWGALSPLAPNVCTTQSEKLGWLLWACVNGYDFNNNPNKYKWSQVVTDKFGSAQGSIHANNLLSNMGNSGYSTDDVLIGYANYTMLDSVQLSTSSVEGNLLAFEIFIFTGSIDNTMTPKPKTDWTCASVNSNYANATCVGSVVVSTDTCRDNSDCHEDGAYCNKGYCNVPETTYLGGGTSTFLNIDPVNPKRKQNTCIPVKNEAGTGYYLQCNDNDNITNYGDPYAFPMSENDSLVQTCS